MEYTILVTRPKHQAETLCYLIEQQGWGAIRFPTLEIVGVNSQLIKQQLQTINQYQWLIFISVNAVNFALSANNGNVESFVPIAIAAVGKTTEKALKTVGLTVDLVPENQFNTEGLLATNEMNNVNGKSCLIIRGKDGRENLANSLCRRGAKVDYLEVYERKKPDCKDIAVIQLLKMGKIDAITINSGEALSNLLLMIDTEFHENLFFVPIIVISNRLKKLAEQYKFKHIFVAKSPEDSAIIETVLSSLTQ